MENSLALERAFYLLRQGYLKINGDGEIWRQAKLIHGQWKSVTARRAENVGGKGYLRLSLQITGVGLRSVMAHRVVWEWYRGPIPAGMQINHKDLNKQNNHPSNLEVVTGAGNIRHSYAHGRVAPWHNTTVWRGKAIVTEERKSRMRELRNQGALLRDIAKKFNLGTTHVHRICAKRRTEGNDC